MAGKMSKMTTWPPTRSSIVPRFYARKADVSPRAFFHDKDDHVTSDSEDSQLEGDDEYDPSVYANFIIDGLQ
jgi:hypothetical protein